ncbi:MAG: hypothetical protein HYV07_29495 [Deltaproteobacteria bacterium]|nr:hypothetical protein [Deltaproteobacteria bacterium]
MVSTHVNARTERHESYPERFAVPDGEVAWLASYQQKPKTMVSEYACECQDRETRKSSRALRGA